MITGYNTDVEFGGVIYHVQTEDKGVDSPVIVTLVYTGGAILASKRARYDDLISSGIDEEALTKRLERQHKLICAAVHAGRIEDLKQMSVREAQAAEADKRANVRDVHAAQSAEKSSQAGAEVMTGSYPTDDSTGLAVKFIDEPELRGGNFITLRFLVTQSSDNGRQGAPNASIIVKTLGTNFTPRSIAGVTDERGLATVSLSLPDFKAGRAAILIQVEANGETAELRRIIFPSSQ